MTTHLFRKRFLRTAIRTGMAALCSLPPAISALEREDLLFYAPFEDSLAAEYSRGEAKPVKPPKTEFAEGVRGKGAVALKRILWDGKDNIRGEEGTVSFWVSPIDWATGDGKNHNFASFDTENGTVRLYQYFPGNLGMLMQAPGKGNRNCWTWARLKKGDAMQITFTWHPGEWALYFNGIPVKKVSDVVLPFGKIRNIAMGDGNTVFDELIVLRRSVMDEEAKALYYRIRKPAAGSLATIPKTASDGKNAQEKLSGAMKISGWSDSILDVANNDPTEAYLSYDEKNLHISFVYPIPAKYRVNPIEYVSQPIRMNARKNDSPELFRDDCFEVLLSPADSGAVHRFAVNGAATRFDSKDGDVSWNGKWSFQSSFDDHYWKVDYTIPFSTLGCGTPRKGERWKMNLRHRAAQVIETDSVWAPTGPGTGSMGELVFGGDIPAVRLEKMTNPADGIVGIEAKLLGLPAGKSGDFKLETEISTTCYAALEPSGDKTLKDKDPTPPEGFKDVRAFAADSGNNASAAVSRALSAPLAADLLVTVKGPDGTPLLVHRRPFAYSPRFDMHVKAVPSRDELLFEIDAGSTTSFDGETSIEISVSDEKGKTVKQLKLDRVTKVKQGVKIDVKGLPPGKYLATAAISSAGAPVKIEKDFSINPKPEWMDSKIGEEEDVPAPWTPLKSDSNSIECWGRKYVYGDSVFPSAVTVLGKELMASPITLKIREKGRLNPVSKAKLTFGDVRPNHVDYTLSGKAGSFNVRTENRMDYDGFTWVKILVTPEKKGASLDELCLEFPYNKEIATHWYNGQYGAGSPSGYIPGKRYVCSPANFARIGDAERGLQICWEHLWNWKLAKPDEAMELLPGKDSYLVRLKLVDHAVSLDAPMEFEIGFQALPSRPQPKGYHGPYWGGSNRKMLQNPEIPVINLWMHCWYFWNYPNLNGEQLENNRNKIVRAWKTQKMTGCIYSNHLTTSPISPEYRYFQEEWRIIPSGIPDFKTLDSMEVSKTVDDHSSHICYGSDSYTDFFLFYLQKSLRYFHGKAPSVPVGLYFDNAGPAVCENEAHGHGVLVNGKRMPVLAVKAWRRASERLRRMLKGITEESWYVVHMSGNPAMACWSFNDIMIPGEQYASYFELKKAQAKLAGKSFAHDYTQLMELDKVRAEFSSMGYGPAQVFLSETWRWRKEASEEELKKADRHLFGMLFVNDVMCWGCDSAKAPVIEALWKHLGWDDKIVFHPYWRNAQYLNMAPYDENKIVASIFEREGKACIFAFNNTDDDVKVNFDLNLSGIGVKGYENGKLIEPIAGKEYPLSGTRVSVDLPKRDFQIYFLK